MNSYDNIQLDKVKEIRLHVEGNSQKIEEIVNDIIQPYIRDLDAYVKYIDECLCDNENPPSDAELDMFCLNLSTLIYFAGGMCEQLGIRDDISKAVYKEMYHTARSNQDKGTVADKDSLAELASQEQFITNVCYNRAWKIVKAKVENAQELLSSCKKVTTRRMNEYQLTHMTNGSSTDKEWR